MCKVFVLDTEKQPLYPIHSAQARQLLRNGKAAIFKRFPFTIILKELRRDSTVSQLRLKIDPGAKTTGIAIFALLNALKETGLPIETGSGGLTKFNRSQQNLPKTHWLDAACVGESTPLLKIKGIKPLLITANGHGTRQSCRTDKFGFPNRHCSRTKFHLSFQTGDIVKAAVTNGKKVGEYIGRIATRATGSFNISTKNGLVQGISHKNCKHIHKKDGYSYAQ